TRAAIVVGRHRRNREYLAHLGVISLDQGDRLLWQADLVDAFAKPHSLRWSDNGRLLLVQFSFRILLIDAATGATLCQSQLQGKAPENKVSPLFYSDDQPAGFIGPSWYAAN